MDHLFAKAVKFTIRKRILGHRLQVGTSFRFHKEFWTLHKLKLNMANCSQFDFFTSDMSYRRRNAGVICHDGLLFVVGGDDGTSNLSNVEVSTSVQ